MPVARNPTRRPRWENGADFFSNRGNFLSRRRATSRRNSLDFLADRLKVQQREAGVRHDLIDAVFALGGEDDLVRLLARVNCSAARAPTSPRWRDLGLPVPPGFTITTEVCTYYYAERSEKLSEGPSSEGAGRARGARPYRASSPARASATPPIRCSSRCAPARRASMPGMMDTVLNLGLNDETVEGSPRSPATRASPMTATAASSRCIRTSCSASSIIISRTSSRPKEDKGVHARHRLDRRRLGRRLVSRATRSASSRETGKPFPQDVARAAVGRDRRGVRLLDERARGHLPPPARHPGTGAPRSTCRRWCSATWARPRRPASPSPAIPRPARARLRRIPDQRAGRGRRRRHPHAAGSHRSARARRPAPTSRRWKRRCRRRSPSSTRSTTCSSALPRHAGHRVHRRAGQAVDAADPQRQAHRQGGAAHRRRLAGRA
jgi:hypothetical protein